MKGFVHSAPVPQIYKAAASIVELVQEKRQSIKELVFSKKYSRINTKGLYALIVETLHHESILCDILRESKILADGRMKPWLARVLITELLWGKKKLPPNDCKPIKAVLDLHSEFVAILKKSVLDGTHENEPRIIKAFVKPRYVRVNTLKMTIEEAMDAFVEEGWHRGYPEVPGDYPSFLAKMADIEETEFVQDFHIPEVFAFAPRTEFYRHNLYKSGCLVLQDKASCLAPFLLAPVPGSTVLDMCAAPGLKATQLAAILKNQGTLHAVEKSKLRHRTLLEFVARHSANVTAVHADATTLTHATLPDVKYVLVDPSCSGSGMDRAGQTFDKERIDKLAGFQTLLLERALLNFPSVERVVYSTCSKYAEENEAVVDRVLKSVNPDPENPNFVLADVLPGWLSRGSDDFDCGAKCVYAREDVDLTTGFFVAVFERVEGGATERRKRIRGKKMRESKHVAEDAGPEVDVDVGEIRTKKRSKREKEDLEDREEIEGETGLIEAGQKQKKKKSKRKEGDHLVAAGEDEVEVRLDLIDSAENGKRKKSKKKKEDQLVAAGEEEVEVRLDLIVAAETGKRKKSKRGVAVDEEVETEVKEEKRKKKRRESGEKI